MAQPWQVLDRVKTGDGVLELRQRGERDFLIMYDSLVLMNSSLHRSEVALGELGCGHLKHEAAPRVLVGGLGMGITLRAVLDALPAHASVVVAELNPVVVDWCRGPLAPLTGAAVNDPRVSIEIADVAEVIRKAGRSGNRFDAVVIDLYKGPHAKTDRVDDPIYGSRAIQATRAALNPGGVFAVWGENYDAGFDNRLIAAGFSTTSERPGRGGLRHVVFVGRLQRSEERNGRRRA